MGEVAACHETPEISRDRQNYACRTPGWIVARSAAAKLPRRSCVNPVEEEPMPDPCQQQEDLVDDIESQLETLQEALEDAPPANKPAIIKQINALDAKLAAAQAALTSCQEAHQPLDAAWSVEFLAVGTQGDQERRITGSVAVTLSFSADRTTFTMQCPQLSGSVGDVRVTVDLLPNTAGTVGDPDAHGFRDMSIGVQATVAIPAADLKEAADLSLSTNATLSVQDLGVNITGSKLNGVGYLTMVGEGTAASGDKLALRLEGKVSPMPWPIT